MSDDIALDLQERTVTGKAVKHLRREGLVPAVIHDHGKPSVHVSGNYVEVMKAYKEVGKHHPLQLKVGSKAYTALIKIAEFEPRKHQLAHVVFGAVNTNEKVTAEIPLRLTEDIPAEKVSLIVIHQLDTVEVEALAKDLPDELVVDASSLVEIGDKLTVADVKAPVGVVILTEPEHAIATVFEPSALAAANDAAGGDAELETEEASDTESESGETEAAGSDEDGSKSEDQSN